MCVLYYAMQVGFNIISNYFNFIIRQQKYQQKCQKNKAIQSILISMISYPQTHAQKFAVQQPIIPAYRQSTQCPQISNLQYCYCVIDSNPLVTGVIAIQPQTAQYKFNRKLYIGDITLTQQQIDDVIDELSFKYTCGKYHMFKNNCNHFCDQLSKILIGVGVPNWLFAATNCLRYFCCCLPHGFVSGLWAIQAIQRQEQNKEDIPLMNKVNK